MNGPSPSELDDVTVRVARALEHLGIPYFLVGSVASSLQGEPRATNDIDVVLQLRDHQVPLLARELGEDFAVDEDSLTNAVHQAGSWNIYFLPLVTKVDLFVAGQGEFEASEFSRRKRVRLGENAQLFVATPEDNVLFKLLWFRKGGETSSNQWRDVIGILRVSKDGFDWAYVQAWAARLGVEDLVARAREEVGGQ